MADNNINKNEIAKKAKSTMFYLFVIFIAFVTVIPLIYLTATSLYSEVEIYEFPKAMLPSLAHDVEIDYNEDWGTYTLARLQNKEIKISETVLDEASGEYIEIDPETGETLDGPVYERQKVYVVKFIGDDTEEIVEYLESQFNVHKTEEQIQAYFDQIDETGEAIQTKFYKSLFSNYIKLFDLPSFDFASGFWNSVKAALYTILLSLSLGGSLGYALARTNIKGKSAIGVGALVVRMFPTIAISVTAAIMLTNFGFYDTMFGLAVVYSIPNIGLTAWITRGIFMGVNKELEEASQVFGATKIQTFLKITFPLVLPAFAASSMYAFITAWNDTGVALLLTTNNPTLSLLLYNIKGGISTIHFAAAGSILLILPAAFFTFYLRKYINQLWG